MARTRIRGDEGQAVPLLIGVLAVGLVLLLALTRVGVAAVNAARARTAADAAALAGARWGEAAASASAADNGGQLVRFAQLGADVLVTVEVGGASATARATLTFDALGPMTLSLAGRLRTLSSWRSRTGPPAPPSRAPMSPL